VTEYHWVITLNAPLPGGGYALFSLEGTVDVSADSTRQEVFRDVYDRARLQMHPVPKRALVAFFSLEPNQLPPA
jgi:hypothetical protein